MRCHEKNFPKGFIYRPSFHEKKSPSNVLSMVSPTLQDEVDHVSVLSILKSFLVFFVPVDQLFRPSSSIVPNTQNNSICACMKPIEIVQIQKAEQNLPSLALGAQVVGLERVGGLAPSAHHVGFRQIELVAVHFLPIPRRPHSHHR